MMRRRSKYYRFDLWARLPWPVSVGIGLIAFAVMRWVLPPVFSQNIFLTGLASISYSLAWMALTFFGVLALIGFVRRHRSTDTPADSTASIAKREATTSGKSRSHRVDPHGSTNVLSNPDAAAGGDTESPTERFDEWTLHALRQLEWKRFELLCASYYDAVGFRSETLRCGADGGIDVKLYRGDMTEPVAVVQCKAWNAKPVGVQQIRELLGVMAHEKVRRGIFLTTATYTPDALAFGAANPILLVDGVGFIEKLCALPKEKQDHLLRIAFDGDYRTPTCPNCGTKAVKRAGKNDSSFWRCRNFPRCHWKLQIAR